jgi:ferredoxin-type protein NapH
MNAGVMDTISRRQRIRKALLIFSFVLMPVTFVYISCPVITEGASAGIATGGLIVFSLIFIGSLFFGRFWCGYLCPSAGLQEIYFPVNPGRVRIGRLNALKYLIFLAVFVPLIFAIYTAGGLGTIDLFYWTKDGISIAYPGNHAILFGQIFVITFFAMVAGRRGFCHYFCPISVLMISGRKIRNLFRWPALHLSADADRCIECGKCTTECPMSLDVQGMVRQGTMEQTECILCANCADICPKGVIRTAWFRRGQA